MQADPKWNNMPGPTEKILPIRERLGVPWDNTVSRQENINRVREAMKKEDQKYKREHFKKYGTRLY